MTDGLRVVGSFEGGSGRYSVAYPSGSRLDLDGELLLIDLDENGVNPAVDSGQEGVFVLDPRAMIRDRDTGAAIYHPRVTVPVDRMAPWVGEWLDEHLAWGVTR